MIMTEEEFREAIVDARKDFTDLQIAGYLKVSIKLVQRWADGTNSPLPLGRKPLVDLLGDLRGY